VKGDGRYGGGCGMWKLVVVSSTPLTQQATSNLFTLLHQTIVRNVTTCSLFKYS